MADSSSLDQGVQDTQASSSLKPLLSCISCRQRKIKCNKAQPCLPCQRSTIQCVYPDRGRVIRRRQDARARNAELLRRISRLESLVSKVDAVNAPTENREQIKRPAEPAPNSILTTPITINGDAFVGGAGSGRLDDQYARFVKLQERRTRYLSTDFWASLNNEVDGLRQLLENPMDDGDEPDDFSPNSTEPRDSSSDFIFQDSGPAMELGTSYPSDIHRSILFRFYFANVDPVCKLLHKPTAYAHLSAAAELFDASNGWKFSSLEAVSFAMYFSTVTSMSAEDCLTYFGEEKDVLVLRYQRSTELALAKADFMNTKENVTLQAFVLYTTTIRSHRRDRSSWTLVSLAVRIAHGLGLHKDSDGREFSAFEAETRRRLWWQILVLDMRASEDRGSEPLIAGGSFNTRMPCNINDKDFGFPNQHPLPDKKEVTEMTFCLILMDVSNTSRNINFIPHADERRALSLEQKEELVKECSERIETHYLAGCDPTDQSTWLVSMIGRLCILKLWLVMQYPLQSRSSTSREFTKGQSLRTVVAYLEIVELIEKNDSAAGFVWLLKTYVPWHALAVALAELCTESQGPVADKAWSIIENSYGKWSNRVADGKDGVLWRPIRNLFKRAQAARQRAQKPVELQFASQPSSLHDNPGLHNGGNVLGTSTLDLETSQISLPDPMALGDPGQMDYTFPHPFEFDVFTSSGVILPDTGQYGAPMNWDDWNEFISDATAGVDIPPSTFMDWSMQM